MPTANISISRLKALVRADVDDARIAEALDQLGCDVDGVETVYRYASRFSSYVLEALGSEALPLTDPTTGDSVEKPEELWEQIGSEQVVRLELLPVRPDLFDAGGLARALRGSLGLEVGLPQYNVVEPGPLGEGVPAHWRVVVDAEIPASRPYIQCAIIRNLQLDEELLRAVMRLQEHLHWALCRDRKFASIGTYDLAALKSPIRYTIVDRESFRFSPLFWGHRDPVSPALMLAEHPKGKDYAHLLDGWARVTALLAANEVVLSLPPVINAEESKLTAETRDVLIDVTGSNLPVVSRALAIMATSLLELDVHGGARLEQVRIEHADGRALLTPDLTPQTMQVSPQRAAALIGVPLTREHVRELLLKMRHGVDVEGPKAKGQGPGTSQSLADSGLRTQDSEIHATESLHVTVAPYRNDILHEVDLIEDVAIAYGYHRIAPTLVPSFTAGAMLPINDLARRAAGVLCGLGFLESQSLVLTSEREHYEKLRRAVSPQRVTLANPISVEQTMLREHLYSGLLALLAASTDQPLPQRVFEVGTVVGNSNQTSTVAAAASRRDPACEDGGKLPPLEVDPLTSAPPQEHRVISALICDSRGAGYAAGRSVLDALLHELGLAFTYAPDANPSALPGRAASLHDASGARIGELFELHPEVLEAFRLENPIVAFSLTLGEEEYS